MPVVMPLHLLTLSKCKTPDEFKATARELLAPALSKYKVCGTDVMFVTYIEPDRTDGGIFKPDRTQQEILFQGNVGLVVGLGPLAFKYDSRGFAWEGDAAKIDDWIVVRFADCWEIHIDGVSCRLIDPENIRGIIETPEIITHRPAWRPLVVSSGAQTAMPFEIGG
jgi:hypothetical protein